MCPVGQPLLNIICAIRVTGSPLRNAWSFIRIRVYVWIAHTPTHTQTHTQTHAHTHKHTHDNI